MRLPQNQTNRREGRAPRHRILILAAVCLGCAGALSAAQKATDGAPLSAAVHPEIWPEMHAAVPRDAAIEARIAKLLSTLSVEEKVGQITEGDIASLTPDDVRKYRLGSVFAGGNSDPGGKYNATPQAWLALADAFHAASMDTSGGGHAIPVIFGVDAVHGHNNIVGATLFPQNIGLGATRNPALIRRIAEATAAEVRSTGMEWTFAPTLTVPRDDRWGRAYEGYSEDPSLVASYAGPMIEGLQGTIGSPGFLDDSHVLATAKHFLGDGGTAGGKDQGDTQVSEAALRDIHGAPYVPALRAGVQSVMASFSSWNGEKMHGNRGLLTDVLKSRMGFDGFIVGDWNAHGQLPGCSNDACPATLLAGVDVPMAPDSWRGIYDSTLAGVKSGAIPMARLDDAVARLLRVKLRMGLFDAPKPSARRLGGRFELLGSPEHRAIARQAVRESLVMLKNDRGLLPLSPTSRVLVAGDGADSVAKQSGGWTLSWQGTGTTPADFPNAQTIWSGIREQVASAGGEATLSVDGTYRQTPDVAIVVFGEDPYAEFQGDIATLSYKSGDDSDLALLKRLRAQKIPTVAVFLTGRPLWMNREINASDAFVVAWLPGSEGGGVGDVLLRTRGGAVAHPMKGKLSFSWPKTAVQTPLNVGDAGYAPQFAFGHGMTYADAGAKAATPSMLAVLPEVSGVTGAQSAGGVFFARGKVAGGWTLSLAGADGTASTPPAARGESPDRALRMEGADHRAQEDARRLTWTAPGRLRLTAPDALDLSRETNGEVLLVFSVRNDGKAAGTTVSVDCGQGCAARVPLGEEIAALPAGQWTTVGVALKCLSLAGADMSRVRAIELGADAGAVLQFSRIALGSEAAGKKVCKTP